MMHFLSGFQFRRAGWIVLFLSVIIPCRAVRGQERSEGRSFYVDCSRTAGGDGSREHPWITLEAAQSHPYGPGDQIALARGTVCHGNFSPQGSGAEGHPIRLTAYGSGYRPRMIASSSDRQILLLFNQEYWQIDSLDLSGAGKYGIFISGDKGPLRHIYLKNLYVHDVMGEAMKNKDNGLVIIGPSAAATVFNDVVADGVDAAHTNQWAGILIGGGNYAYAADAPLNRGITVSNSTVHDVFGDGIILFRDQDAQIKTSAAWQTGMQPTETTGTPNAIWTWTCTDCTVQDNEAYLTDSPGVDGGAYDIDWDNTRNTVQRNFAHDTQGYCVAVFAAGYATTDSVVRDNLCVDNGLSPRLSALQGAIYLHTWNDGPIRGLRIENNAIQWNPPVAEAAAIVNDALITGSPAVFSHNHIVTTAPRVYTSNAQLAPSANTYRAANEPRFTFGDHRDVTLATLQASGIDTGSRVLPMAPEVPRATLLRIECTLDLHLDADGLMAPDSRAQLVVLRNLAGEYGPERLHVTVHLLNKDTGAAEANALRDLDDIYPGMLNFDHKPATGVLAGVVRMFSSKGSLLQQWRGFQNAATLGGAIRALLGAPQYSHMQRLKVREESK